MYMMLAIAIALIGAVIGFILGCIAPKAAYKVAAYKCKLRGYELQKSKSLFRRVICCIFAAAYIAFGFVCVVLPVVMESQFPAWCDMLFPGAILAAFVFIAMIISLVDIDTHLIPNELVVLLFGAGLVYRIMLCGGIKALLSSLLAAAAALTFMIVTLALYYVVKKRMGMGAGDIKYILVISIILGWDNMVYFLIGTSAAILLYVFAAVKFHMLRLSDYFPYAAHLSIGFLGALAYSSLIHLIEAFKLAIYSAF